MVVVPKPLGAGLWYGQMKFLNLEVLFGILLQLAGKKSSKLLISPKRRKI